MVVEWWWLAAAAIAAGLAAAAIPAARARRRRLAADPPPESKDWIRRKYLDVAYASVSTRQKLDVYLPNEGSGPFPVVVFAHGGSFVEGDKADWQLNSALQGVRRGYAVVSVGYRLADEAFFPAAVQDVAAAIRFLRAHADVYDLDGSRMAVWGTSAGANLAAIVAAAAHQRVFDDPALGHPNGSSEVSAVVDFCGPKDFMTMEAQLRATGARRDARGAAESHELRYLGGRVADVPDIARAANPATYIGPRTPPFLIQHGDADDIVPVLQSVDFAARLRDRGVAVTLHILKGAGHADRAFDAAENLDKVFAFLDAHLMT